MSCFSVYCNLMFIISNYNGVGNKYSLLHLGNSKMKKLLLKRLYFNKRKSIKLFITYVIIFTIVLSFALLLPAIMDTTTDGYRTSDYDYMVTYFDKKNMEELENNENISQIYPVRIVTGIVTSKFSKLNGIDIYLADEWDKNNLTPFNANRKEYGSINEKIDNGIILDTITANNLHVKVGDSVSLEIGEQNLSYKVTMLVNPVLMGQPVVECLYNNYFRDVWNSYYQEEPTYSILYVKAKNLNRLDNYLLKEYVATQMIGESKEDIQIMNLQSNLSRAYQLELAENSLEYAPPVTVVVSLLGMAILGLFIVREATNKIEDIGKTIATLGVMGLRKSTIILFTFAGQVLYLVPASIVSIILVKLGIYDCLIGNYYLSWKLVYSALELIFIMIIIISLLSGILLSVRLKGSTILKNLREEA